MNRGVAAAVLSVALTIACTDDSPPRSHASSAAPVSSGSEQALARTMARTLADGLQQGANGRISSTQADCLVNEITARLRPDVLGDIASDLPAPNALPRPTRDAFAAAFDRCLPGDLAGQLKRRFGL